MNNTLKNSRGEHFGRIGASACFNYSDGTKAKVGDMVTLYHNGDFRGASYIVQPELTPFVMGIKSIFIRNGIGEGDDYNWRIEKLKDASEITHGMKDSNGIIANIVCETQTNLVKQGTEWLYSFSIVNMVNFLNRETMIEGIKKDIDNGILVFSNKVFTSAKMINQETGQVIDLLS